MMENVNLEKILFLDIETVPQTYEYEKESEELRDLWEYKFQRIKNQYAENATAEETYLKGAGIYAEFGKIVCISIGFIHYKNGEKHFRIRSFFDENERSLLQNFIKTLVSFPPHIFLCGHNVKEFDIPYINRRLLVNGLSLPKVLNVLGKKPWETNFIDTMEMWKFGDFKTYTSLKLLTHIFSIPTPKDDIDGSQVAEVYYIEKNIQRIVTYCEKDVLATAQLYLKMTGNSIIKDENIKIVI